MLFNNIFKLKGNNKIGMYTLYQYYVSTQISFDISTNFNELKKLQNGSIYDKHLEITKNRTQNSRNNIIKRKANQDKLPTALIKIFNAKNSNDVLNVINEYRLIEYKHINQRRFYGSCVKILGDLDDFKNAWKILNECQEKGIMDAELFAAKMWLIMCENRSPSSLQIILDMFDAYMHDNRFRRGMDDAIIYSMVLESARKVYISDIIDIYMYMEINM